jgi:hypothetical protein
MPPFFGIYPSLRRYCLFGKRNVYYFFMNEDNEITWFEPAACAKRLREERMPARGACGNFHGNHCHIVINRAATV